MERAYDDAKYGRYSARPYMDVVIPSLTDPSVAPPGKHVMSCFVQYAPYHLKGASWDDERERFGDVVIDTLAEHAPNLKSLILHRQVITPLDLEREWGLSEGNIFQGELALEQLLFLRPVPGWAKYRTPVRDLYMCGSATHPGGGIMGAPGRNAALEILVRLRAAASRGQDVTDVIFVGGGTQWPGSRHSPGTPRHEDARARGALRRRRRRHHRNAAPGIPDFHARARSAACGSADGGAAAGRARPRADRARPASLRASPGWPQPGARPRHRCNRPQHRELFRR